MPPYCPHVFRDTVLNLVLWPRFDEDTHLAGLGLVRFLLDCPELEGEVMLLLRPLWRWDARGVLDPLYYQKQFLEPDAPLESEWCELWLQASSASADRVADIIRRWQTQHTDARAHVGWQGEGGALWGPLSRGLQDCQYACARTEWAQRFLAEVPAEQIAWLLKLIWHRAAVVIADHCLKGASPIILDPRSDQTRISGLAGDILADMTAGACGIAVPSDPLDPSEYAVSHLATFTINAVTQVLPARAVPVYQLEQYYAADENLGHQATHPWKFDSRDTYLRRLREARPLRDWSTSDSA